MLLQIVVAALIINGQITAVNGNQLSLQTCTGGVTVDATEAIKNEKTVELVVGKWVGLNGTWTDLKTFHATAIWNKHLACPPPAQ